jgi:SsrA-binding protein
MKNMKNYKKSMAKDHKSKDKIKVINYNKKISFDYTIYQRIECGIALLGTEVKSARLQGCSIQQASCAIEKNTIFLYNMNIPIYKKCFSNNHEPTRTRLLLSHKKETKKILGLINKNQWHLLPEKVFFNENNLLKVMLALGKINKKIDQRENIRAKEEKKEILKLNTMIF